MFRVIHLLQMKFSAKINVYFYITYGTIIFICIVFHNGTIQFTVKKYKKTTSINKLNCKNTERLVTNIRMSELHCGGQPRKKIRLGAEFIYEKYD